MSIKRIAYLPLSSYPEALADDLILGAIGFAAAFQLGLAVDTFEVTLPRRPSGFGDALLDVSGLIQASEEKSRAECRRLEDLLRANAPAESGLSVHHRKVASGLMLDAAATEARYHDLALIPWSGQSHAPQDMAEAILFGAGRPVLLLPPGAAAAPLSHLAIAWDGSRVAARALGDALPLLQPGGRVSVLTLRGEKPLGADNIAEKLATALKQRGIEASFRDIDRGDQPIAARLQQAARDQGAQLLAMGGFGHSRLRDFVLGGATKGILSHLEMPVLLAH